MNLAKIRKDLKKYRFSTEDGKPINNNKWYQYKWEGDDVFKILIDDTWHISDSINFEFNN